MARNPNGSGPIIDEAAIDELLTRGVDSVYPSPDALRDALMSGRQLTAYMGIDPTAPDMHVGHESQLLKLQRLQNLGHNVILLIGDFTGRIGDPSDRSAARIKLTTEEVLANAASYKQQASKILDFDRPGNPVQLRFNSEWLGKMTFEDVVELAGELTVQQMLQRRSFSDRIAQGKPVGLHEFLYPLMQGYDSVAMGIDLEVGGSDQIFNMLVGTDMVRRHNGKQKFVIAGDLLTDPSGRKIGKTEGNMITLNDDPGVMFHKIMMWGDAITPHALELCSSLPMSQVEAIRAQLASGELSGLEGKMFLARTIVSDLHGADAAAAAETEYRQLTSSSSKDLDIGSVATVPVEPGDGIVSLLVRSGLAKSNSAARNLLASGAVRINDVKVDESWLASDEYAGAVLQVGKRKRDNFRRLELNQ